jgi:CubicO group peptidase (beta-lactamase class C family)
MHLLSLLLLFAVAQETNENSTTLECIDCIDAGGVETVGEALTGVIEEEVVKNPEADLEIINNNVSSVELHENVGLVYTIVYAEGSHSASLGKEYSEETPFEVGSVSKIFTALLLDDMVTKGEVTLQTTVGDILPDVKMREEVAAITLEQLATHSSGLERMPPNLGTLHIILHAKNPYQKYNRQKLHKALSKAKITEEGSSYSNFGMGLLGDLLSVKAGKPYCELIDERITKPHNLNTVTCSSIPEGTAQPHLWTGDENPVWEFDSLSGAGAMRANSVELAALLSHIDVLYKESALAYRLPNHLKTHYKDDKTEVGLGWFIQEFSSERCYFHNGMTGGSSSFVGVCPDQHFAVIALMNQQDLKFTLTAAGLQSMDDLVKHRMQEQVEEEAKQVEEDTEQVEEGTEKVEEEQ